MRSAIRKPRAELPSLAAQFGVRSGRQVARDLATVLRGWARREGFALETGTFGLFRPELSLPAYVGLAPSDGIAPIFNLFDRVGGGRGYRNAVSRRTARDYRGGRLTYDEHDGTDFVCPRGTPIVAAAPGVVVATRDTWLRGGLTACVDHGDGVVTQYTHLARMLVEVGERVVRGQPIALSGVAGLDMLAGAPWVPPHVHFMVWIDGAPVDPFLAAKEAPRPGTWARLDTIGGPLAGDPSPSAIATGNLDRRALDAIGDACTSPRIRDEIAAARSDAGRAAIVEDALHHDRGAWPKGLRAPKIRLGGEPSRVRLTLPLPSSIYRTAAPADARWTAPSPVRVGGGERGRASS